MHNLMHHLNIGNLRRAFQELKGSRASGIDRVTKHGYKACLDENIQELYTRIRKGGWRPRPSREVLIPKPQGGTRPLAIGCVEDKIVQTLVSRILEAIYEPQFHPSSYGFRRGKSAHQALRHLYRAIRARKETCVVVEVDIEKFFDSMDHEWLMERIEERIGDGHFLRLLRRLLRNSVLGQDGRVRVNEVGAPQGSPVSPMLANIYLHHLLDNWFAENFAQEGEMVRYADDVVFVLRDEETANRFQSALNERIKEGGLRIHPDKTKVIPFNHRTPEGNVDLLGWTLFWGRGWRRKGDRPLKVKTSTKSLNRSMKAFTAWIKAYRNRWPLKRLWKMAALKLRGHFNYFGVSTNGKRLNHFYHACILSLFKWLNRRSQKASFTWEKFLRKLRYNPLPRPPLSFELIEITGRPGTGWKQKPKSRMRELRKSGSVRSIGQTPVFT
jgi:group II intron reverse transcriptase/maturase